MKITVNNKNFEVICDADTLLFDLLRQLGFKSVKCGCDTTNCGLCTVWIDEKPMLSCAVLAVSVEGQKITTLEGVAKEAEAFGTFMAAEGADQCGFCSPGLIMNILAMKRECANLTAEEVRHYLAGNLCRCTGYMGQMRALEKYLGLGEVQNESC
ncbi:MAG: (2Fe-2S)-binding protein [Cellulosilyticaceae bacterium]